jgi:hypothetical protein
MHRSLLVMGPLLETTRGSKLFDPLYLQLNSVAFNNLNPSKTSISAAKNPLLGVCSRTRSTMRWGSRGSSSSNYNTVGGEQQKQEPQDVGRIEQLKQREAELVRALNAVRRDKHAFSRQRPLTIGIIGFGRFGQFMARTFVKQHHKVVATSRSDYSDIAIQVQNRRMDWNRKSI